MVKDFPKGFQFCFNSNQAGHVRVECPQLVSRAVQALVPTTLHITDGQKGKAEAQSA